MFRPKRNVISLPNEIQLELELLFATEPIPTAKVIPFPRKARPLWKKPEWMRREEQEWSETAIAQLRTGMLTKNLHLIAHAALNAEARADLKAWFASDEIEPFSFVVCAIESGYNPVPLRQKLLTILSTGCE